jgi:AraC-like DNA-binding protein
MDQLRLSNLPSRSTIKRHGHAQPYAAVVVSGAYEEAGDNGRHRVGTGDVLIHAPYSAHCDRIPNGHNRVLDIPLPSTAVQSGSLGRVRDVDAIVNVAIKDPREAVDALLEQLVVIEPTVIDVPDMLAAALIGDSPPPIATWAHQHGIARETLSRQFQSLYEVAPARYRVEARARRAWQMIRTQAKLSLAEVATACGFADQAHLTRDLVSLTGRTPGDWRARALKSSHLFKTAVLR